MSITTQDIKLMASERLYDEDDGGGMMSAVVVEDGVVNNLFPDISRLDRAYGRVNMRKAYVSVETDNRDTFYGAHAIITDAPEDPRVSVIMFTTKSFTDERTNARDRIESYLAPGTPSQLVLLGNQLAGQRTLSCYAKTTTPPPEPGQVLVLRRENSSGALIGAEQYVRISDVDAVEETFDDGNRSFKRILYTLSITTPLTATFNGAANVVASENHGSPTVLRTTQIADASRYYSIVKLDEDITAGDMTIKAESIFGRLVPSATAESPIIDVQAGTARPNIVSSGAAYSLTVSIAGGTVSFGRPFVPSTVELGSYKDDGKGILKDTAGVSRGEVFYESGLITGITGLSGSQTLKAEPATAVYDVSLTLVEEIDMANQGYTYIKTMRPTPQPGTLTVDYMAQGRWYRMHDVGAGELKDDVGGAGSLNYATGTAMVTLGALPDVGSKVIFSWTTPTHYDGGANVIPVSAEPALIEFVVEEGGINPNSLTLTWAAGGITKTATDNGSGVLTGDAAGIVDYATGFISMKPSLIIDSSSVIQVDYDVPESTKEVVDAYTIVGNNVVISITEAPIKARSFGGTFTFAWEQEYVQSSIFGSMRYRKSTGTQTATIIDNGNGTVSVDFGVLKSAGTINYITGEVVLPVKYSHTKDKGLGEEYRYKGEIVGSIAITFSDVSPSIETITEVVDVPAPVIRLAPTNLRQIMPGSVEFQWNGKTYIDREGIIYTDWNRANGAASPVGSINYATGAVSLTTWLGGGSNAISIKTMLTSVGEWLASEISFRTSGAPLRTSSFFIRAVRADGNVISATSSSDGSLTATEIAGSINHETGIAAIKFGKFVLDSSLTIEEKAEPWYVNGEVLPDGTIWKPTYVEPSSIKYNAVVYSVMPLDSSILGLDPVRLPMDGRVPIIRPGDVVVVHSSRSFTLPTGLIAGQNINIGELQLAACTLKDAAGEAVDAELYSVNRETGIITMATPLDLSEYAQPLVAHYRVEDMALVNEAEINGQLRLVGTISRDYSAANTWVSSALIFGDLSSRVTNLFSQTTWNNTWADSRSGSPTTAQYNDRLYPIVVVNKNSIRERWAMIFTSSTTFNIVGEESGVIGTGSITADCAPNNPITGEPYFTIPANGWGVGWATNNVLRFNTTAAHAPVWIARTTINGAPTKQDDSFRLQIRGDAD